MIPEGVPRVRGWEPGYLALHRSGELAARVEQALAGLAACRVCPRDCDVDRLGDRHAFCRTGRYAAVSSAFPHFGEEDCLRGWNGSGTIFFTHCNLRCVFCQNFETSQLGEGEQLDARGLARLIGALAASVIPLVPHQSGCAEQAIDLRDVPGPPRQDVARQDVARWIWCCVT